MNPRIEKLNAEYRKNEDKIAGLKARNKAIARKVKELENTQLIGLFEALHMTPEAFAAFAAERKNMAAGEDGAHEEI